MGKVILRYLDYNGEKGTAQFPTLDLTAANFDAQATLRGNLVTAIAGICNGTLNYTAHYAIATEGSSALPGDAATQREVKWLCRYHATTSGKPSTLEIPTADYAVLANNVDTLDLTGGVGQAFKTAFDALVRGEDGTAAILDSVTLVHRNI